MAKLISCKCPQCDANLEIEEGRVTAFCTYCGAKVVIESESIKEVHKYYHDETKEKEIEANERLANKQMDEEARKKKFKTKLILIYIGVCLAMILASYICTKVEYTNTIYVYLAAFIVLTLPGLIIATRHIAKNGGTSVHTHESHSGFLGLHKESSETVTTAADKAIFIWIAYILIIAGWIFLPKLFESDLFSSSGRNTTASQPASPSAATVPDYFNISVKDNIIPDSEVGNKYSYVLNKWNYYEATILSTSQIQIKNYYRVSTDDDFKMDHDVCTVSNDNADNDFTWLNGDHSVFLVTIIDSQTNDFETYRRTGFTKIDESSDAWEDEKSTPGSKTFVYQSDKWDQYRGIQISDNVIKIENWGRFDASEDDFKHDYDLCIIDTNNTNDSFEWTDDNHSSFTFNLVDSENSKLETTSNVTFLYDDSLE